MSELKADPLDLDRWADDGGPAVCDGRPISGPDFPSWETGVDGAEFHADPRTLIAAGVLEAAMSGCGAAGLASLIHRDRQTDALVVGRVGRDAVQAAYLLADEVLRQAWGDEPEGAK
jgi:hypothetical protein